MPSPTTASFSTALRELPQVSSPRAMARTMTVRVWVAALPPMLATMVMSTASITTSSMVAWNARTTNAASAAVTRFMASHGSRFRADSPAGVNTCSSPLTPASR